MNVSADQSLLLAVLDWYRAMGVDCACTDDPIDWLARGNNTGSLVASPQLEANRPSAAVPAPSPRPAVPPRPMQPPPRPQAAPAAAGGGEQRELAAKASTLTELRQAVQAFDGCALKATAKNLCFYRGASASRVMLIGEAPGRDEDLEGKPFVGRAGQLLDKMLAAIGLDESSVHITNIVYWRPPGNRTPSPQEAEACRPFLERQVELVAPEIVVLLGGAAAKAVLNEADGIMRLRGRWRDARIGRHECRVIATLHPAYLLRTPAAKRLAWQDLIAIKAALAD